MNVLSVESLGHVSCRFKDSCVLVKLQSLEHTEHYVVDVPIDFFQRKHVSELLRLIALDEILHVWQLYHSHQLIYSDITSLELDSTKEVHSGACPWHYLASAELEMTLLFDNLEVISEETEVGVSEAQIASQVAYCEVPDARVHLRLVRFPARHHVHVLWVSAILEHLSFLELPASLEHIELVVKWMLEHCDREI